MKSIYVRFVKKGTHFFGGASEEGYSNVAYLANRHFHFFHYKVQAEVFGNDREIEFHQFMDFCERQAASGDMGGLSCEDMADILARAILRVYPGRCLSIDVSEDGVNGAYCTYEGVDSSP